jgi:peroxin-7
MRQLSLLYTGNQQCYSVRYSPFDNSLLACVSCDKFGISGGASVFIIQVSFTNNPKSFLHLKYNYWINNKHQERAFLDSKFAIVESYRTNHSLFDIDWSPIDQSLLLSGNGDGSVSVWKYDLNNNNNMRKPVFSNRHHNKEVYSVMWEPSGISIFLF